MLLVTLFSGEIRLNSVSVWSAVKCQEQVVFYSGGSRPSDGGGGGGSEIRRKGMGGGGGGEAGPLPWIRHCLMYS